MASVIFGIHDISVQFYVNGAAGKGLYFRRVGYPDCSTVKEILEMGCGFWNVGNAYHIYVVRSRNQDQRENALH